MRNKVWPLLTALILGGALVPAGQATTSDPLPRVPPGFAIHPFAAIDGAPTSVAFGPAVLGLGDTMYVTDLVGGRVVTLDAALPAGGPAATFADGFNSPLGVVVDDAGRVFVADSEPSRPGPFGVRPYGRVWRVEDSNGDGTADRQEVVLKDLPNGRHNTNGLALGADGMLYVANGNSTDDGTEGGDPEVTPWSGSVVRVDPDVTDVSLADLDPQTALVASGMRNLYDVAFSPLDPSSLFIPMNGLDDARSDSDTAGDPAGLELEDSDDLLYSTDTDDTITVTDPVTGETSEEPVIDDFGFPSCLYNEAKKGNLQPYNNPNATTISTFGQCPVATVPRPLDSFGLHVSANGLAFQAGGAWGPDFQNDLFVTEFGNLFGPEPVGHEVVRVELDPTGTHVVRQSEFVSGIVPLDVTFGPDGSMFVAELGGTIYRVTKLVDTPSRVVVTMAQFQFIPALVSVPEGSTVRWTNADALGVSHNATGQISIGLQGQGTAGEIATPSISPGQSADVRMDEPGVYKYVCTIHPQTMHGTIVVAPSGS